MKIAVMMRAMDQDSGFRALTESLIDHMLQIDGKNSYLLLYRTPKWYGRFSSYSHAKEVLVTAPHKLLWDQVAVPYQAWKEGADIIFHTKFSIPLFSHCPVAMGIQEPVWFTFPKHYERKDRIFQRIMIPLSLRRAAHVFPNSNFILEENRRVFNLSLRNSTVMYSAPDKHFRPIDDTNALQDFRRKYELPEKFILVVTRANHAGYQSNAFYPGKNPEVAFRAFARIRSEIPHKLLMAGPRVRDYLLHTEGKDVNLEGVHFVTFIPYEELHMLYNTADVFVNPCGYEGCPNTVLQAMACGCAMVVTDTGGSADVSGDAAQLAKAYDHVDLAEKIKMVLNDALLRQELQQRSLKRAAAFSWESTARLTLAGLTRAVEQRTASRHTLQGS
jgi:glycosyltransferase involved in cell wall biosynthesis